MLYRDDVYIQLGSGSTQRESKVSKAVEVVQSGRQSVSLKLDLTSPVAITGTREMAGSPTTIPLQPPPNPSTLLEICLSFGDPDSNHRDG